jgi:hypothetical protein
VLWRLTLRGEVCIGGERDVAKAPLGGMSEYVAGMSRNGILVIEYWYRRGFIKSKSRSSCEWEEGAGYILQYTTAMDWRGVVGNVSVLSSGLL